MFWHKMEKQKLESKKHKLLVKNMVLAYVKKLKRNCLALAGLSNFMRTFKERVLAEALIELQLGYCSLVYMCF